MLRTNLSTRPFYNERAVHLLLFLAALIVVVVTAFNAIRIVSLSRQNTELSSLVRRDHDEAERLGAEAQRIRAGIDQKELESTAQAAALANSLIDQRTFSWTELFNHLEETLPADVMLSAIRPNFRDQAIVIQMTVLARRTEDVEEFMEKLEETGAFGNVLPTTQDTTEEGLHRLLLEASYTPVEAEEPAKAAPAAAAPSGTPASPPSTSPAAPEGGGK